MAMLRLFASIREAAGERVVAVAGATVDEVIWGAEARFGETFAALVPTCRVWLNGEPTTGSAPVTDADEVALLPPVSGGA